MKLCREASRKLVVDRFNKLKTCGLAMELCLHIRMNRALLKKKNVENFCKQIAQLCREAGCQEQSDLCIQAILHLRENKEKEYLVTCTQSCTKCGEERLKKKGFQAIRLPTTSSDKPVYVS